MLHMTEAEIVGRYRRAENQSTQVGILAELNCCDKSEIIEVLERNGIELKKRGRKKPVSKDKDKKEEPVKSPAKEESLPAIVRTAITEKMIAVQEKIDLQKEKISRQQEMMDHENETLKGMEQELRTLVDFLQGAAG